jgi:hypothetical protein
MFRGMEERRTSTRQRVLRSARIRFGGGSDAVDCVVRDISGGGAQIFVLSVNGIPSEFRLEFDQASARDCFVRWRVPNTLGVVFLSPRAAGLQP